MDKGYTILSKMEVIKENGEMVLVKVLGSLLILIIISTLECILTIENMEKESMNSPPERDMKEISWMDLGKDMEFIILWMEMYLKGNGEMICNMEKENTLGQMVYPLKDNGLMIKRMDMESNMVLLETKSKFGRMES